MPCGLGKFACGKFWLLAPIVLHAGLSRKVLGDVLESGSLGRDQMFQPGGWRPRSGVAGLEQSQQKISFVFAHHVVAFAAQLGIERELLAKLPPDREVGPIGQMFGVQGTGFESQVASGEAARQSLPVFFDPHWWRCQEFWLDWPTPK